MAKITDRIISDYLQTEIESLRIKGFDAELRAGISAVVREIVKGKVNSGSGQMDFSEIDDGFRTLVEKAGITRKTYMVPSVGDYVHVNDLCRNVAQLDEAWQHLWKKGEETIAEAKKLKRLHRAVSSNAKALPKNA